MVASPEPIHSLNNSDRIPTTETPYQEEMCEKLIQLSFAKIVYSKSERGGAKLHKNLLILHLLQKARVEQRNRLLNATMVNNLTSQVNAYQQQQTSDSRDDISCENSAVCFVENPNPNDIEQMQTGQSTDNDGGSGDEDKDGAEDAIEIDETSGRQQAAVTIVPCGEGDSSDDELGTLSTHSCDGHLASPCLSSSAPRASPESGVDGNYCPGTTFIQWSPERRQHETRQTNGNVDDFDFSIDVKEAANVELQTAAHEELGGELEMSRCGQDFSGDEIGLRHHSDKPRHSVRHRRQRSASLKGNHSSSSSSSSDSDESSEEEEESHHPAEKDKSDTKRIGSDKKSPNCLKRKLNDSSCCSDPTSIQGPSCDWFTSPKVACIAHGPAATEHAASVQQEQHQNLNGLISVLQSAALTSDEPAQIGSNANRDHEDTQLDLAVRIYDPDSVDDSSSLTHSLSCPGLMELTCES